MSKETSANAELTIPAGEVIRGGIQGAIKSLMGAGEPPDVPDEEETPGTQEKKTDLSNTDTPEAEEGGGQEEQAQEQAEQEQPEAEEAPLTEFDDPKDANLPAWAVKRIGHYTAKQKEAAKALDEEKAKRAELEAKVTQLEQAQSQPAAPSHSPNEPLGDVTDEATLAKRIDEAWTLKEWAETNADGTQVDDGKGGTVDYTPEQVRKIKVNAEAIIHRHAPKRQQFIAQKQQYDRIAAENYPWLKDRSSKEYQMLQQGMKSMPGLAALPYATLAAAQWVRGFMIEQQEKASKASKPTPKMPVTKPKPQPGTPGTAPPTPSRSDVKRERFLKNPEDLEGRTEFIKGALGIG